MASSSQTGDREATVATTTDPLSDHVAGQDDIRPSDAKTDEKDNFTQELKDNLPDNLEFRPLTLRDWFLWLTVSFDVVVVGLLLVITFRQNFTLLDEWAYFVIQFLPLIVGTVTSTTLEAIMLNLSRITPFMRSAQDEGDIIANTILKPFMPFLGIRDSIETKNYHLFLANILEFGGGIILGLKASLLSSSYPDISVNVTSWTLYSLFVIYWVIIFYILFILFYLRCRKTGLRKDWDVVTIADHLTLFRHSNLKAIFEGSCIATRQSMENVLGNTRIKLRYWKRKDGAIWYGFRAVGSEDKKADERSNRILKLDDISEIRFNSSFHQMRSPWTIISLTFALILLAVYLAALFMGNVFYLPTAISKGMAEFVFPFLLTLVAATYGVFWEDMYTFTTITQPYEAMSHQEEMSRDALNRRANTKDKFQLALAEDTVLLPYNGMPRYIAMFEALTRGHPKVFRVAVFATLQRVLPIVVGASVTIWPAEVDGDGNQMGCAVEFSTPLGIVTIIWMVVYLTVIPYEILESGYTRHLPRANLTIADLLSWTCSSRLLCEDGDDANGSINTDTETPATPDHTIEMKEIGEREDQPTERTNLLAGNPLDVFAEGRLSQKWFMEARLRLASENTRFVFGLDEITVRDKSKSGSELEKKLYALGIKSVDVNTEVDAQTTLSRSTQGLRRGIGKDVPSVPDVESRAAAPTADRFEIIGAGKPFSVIVEPERPVDVAGTVGDQAGQRAGAAMGMQGGDDATGTQGDDDVPASEE